MREGWKAEQWDGKLNNLRERMRGQSSYSQVGGIKLSTVGAKSRERVMGFFVVVCLMRSLDRSSDRHRAKKRKKQGVLVDSQDCWERGSH